ncbi:hypothetical protein [Aliamphritea ceti]|uniref:hypothetical protein n=1 Tax=Aliamphritea ceti TaxID=1524258 RepID=UPI0021C45113|nr:hypothetical protein [Aliamphritea ceti]
MKLLHVFSVILILCSQVHASDIEEKSAIKVIEAFHQAYFNDPSGIDDVVAPGIRKGSKLYFPDIPRPMPIRSINRQEADAPITLKIVEVKRFKDGEFDVYMTTALIGRIGETDSSESTVLFWLKQHEQTPKVFGLKYKNAVVFDGIESKVKNIEKVVASGSINQINGAFGFEEADTLNEKIQWLSPALIRDDVSFTGSGQGVFGEDYRTYFRTYDNRAQKSENYKIVTQCEIVDPNLNVDCKFLF